MPYFICFKDSGRSDIRGLETDYLMGFTCIENESTAEEAIASAADQFGEELEGWRAVEMTAEQVEALTRR